MATGRDANKQDQASASWPWQNWCLHVWLKNEVGSGAAYFLKGHSIELQEYFNLGEHATVFQVEIFAINTTSLALLEVQIEDELINFYINSKSSISHSLESYTVKDKSLVECKRHLNKFVEYGTRVRLNWTPGHWDQKGNEIADRLAKRGVDLEVERITVPKSTYIQMCHN